MKKFNTEYTIAKEANIYEVKNVIKNLWGNTSEDWITIYEDSEEAPNYIQVYPGIEYPEDDVLGFLERVFCLSKEDARKLDNLSMVEYRKYDDSKDFKHYRGYFPEESVVMGYVENFMNDEEVDVKNWLDVTDQFK